MELYQSIGAPTGIAADDQFICFAEPFFREASISS